jgi:hypothetical protein
MRPPKSVNAYKKNSAPGYKRMKEQVRIIACCNASDNQKLKLAFVEKSIKKNPPALKNINCTALPLWYNKQRSVWVNSETLRFLCTKFFCLAENFLKKT